MCDPRLAFGQNKMRGPHLLAKLWVRVPLSEHETRIWPLSKTKCDVRIFLPECETRVEEQGLFKSTHKCEVRIHPPKVKKSAKIESPHPPGFKACSFDAPTMDLRDYLIKSGVSIKSPHNAAASDSL